MAVEVDVDAICDGEDVLIGGIMEHIEQAGVHSGDSSCTLPPFTLSDELQQRMAEQVRKLAHGLKVVGLMNTQFAIQQDEIYLLEVNPRASRTVPFVSKAIGAPLAKVAAKVMAGSKLKELGLTEQRIPGYYSVKEAVFPFLKFPGADPILGPEMKSTGEVMATGRSFAEAYSKARQASGVVLPDGGSVIISVRDRDKPAAVEVGRDLQKRGFNIIATGGTEVALREAGVPCQRINKVREGRPHIVDAIKNGNIDLIINTTEGKQAINESHEIRREAVRGKITYYTTVSGAKAGALALDYLDALDVNCLQALHKEIA